MIFAATLLWAIFLWVLAIEKMASPPPLGLESYVKHFTNWSWTFAALFYVLVLPFIIPSTTCCINVRTSAAVVAWCFFPLNLIVWYVAAAVFVLLVKDPEFITDLFESMEPGIVMVWNDVFHVVPVIALLFFASINYYLLFFGLNRWFVSARGCCGSGCVALGYFYQLIGGTLIVVAAYFITLAALGTSVNEVYGTDIPIGAGLAFLVLVALLVNGIPLLALGCCRRVDDESMTPRYDEARAMLKGDDEIFGERRRKLEDVLNDSLLSTATESHLVAETSVRRRPESSASRYEW